MKWDRMPIMRPAVLLCLVLFLPTLALAATRDELLAQAQAADALGGALTAAVSQASGELDRARKNPVAKPVTLPIARASKRITYRELFDRTVQRIQKQGDSAMDPALKNMPSGQLFDEMTTLQQYNIAQYLRLVRMLDQIQASRIPTTMPALESLGQQKATNDPMWQKQRGELRYAVVARIINGQSPRQEPAPQPQLSAPSTYAGGQVGGSDDPRWRPYFYGSQDPMSGWSTEVYSDPFGFRGGGGVYFRTDTRVNTDYDPRLNGLHDRRVNIDADRRLNIHVDPRENF